MNKHIEIWNIARKLKLGADFYEGLDTLLTKIESKDQQLILQNVSNAKHDCFGKGDLQYVYENVDTGFMSFEDWFKEYTLPI